MGVPAFVLLESSLILLLCFRSFCRELAEVHGELDARHLLRVLGLRLGRLSQPQFFQLHPLVVGPATEAPAIK